MGNFNDDYTYDDEIEKRLFFQTSNKSIAENMKRNIERMQQLDNIRPEELVSPTVPQNKIFLEHYKRKGYEFNFEKLKSYETGKMVDVWELRILGNLGDFIKMMRAVICMLTTELEIAEKMEGENDETAS